jgi:hypothetical protein
VISEKLTAVIDPAIAVTVQNKQAVIRPNPAREFSKTVSVMVELDVRAFSKRFHSITIQVKDEGAAGGCGRVEHIL